MMPRRIAHILTLAFACLVPVGASWGDDPTPMPPVPVPVPVPAPVVPPVVVVTPAPKAVINLDKSASPGDLITLDGTESVGETFAWESLSGKKVKAFPGGREAVFASGTPGRYEFLLIVAGNVNGKTVISTARAAITIEGPAPPAPTPPPGPAPGPTPDPTPTPVPPTILGKLNVSLIVDMNTIDPPLAVVRQGDAIRPAFSQFDAVYRTYSSAAPDIAALNLTSFVTAKGLPTLIVQDANGKIIIAEKAPLTEAEVIARVKGLRGGR